MIGIFFCHSHDTQQQREGSWTPCVAFCTTVALYCGVWCVRFIQTFESAQADPYRADPSEPLPIETRVMHCLLVINSSEWSLRSVCDISAFVCMLRVAFFRSFLLQNKDEIQHHSFIFLLLRCLKTNKHCLSLPDLESYPYHPGREVEILGRHHIGRLQSTFRNLCHKRSPICQTQQQLCLLAAHDIFNLEQATLRKNRQ